MTAKLVGLISGVLLLCLSAFALLMHYYQGQVRREVARTVSEVGRATIRTLEAGPSIYQWATSYDKDLSFRFETGWVSDDNDPHAAPIEIEVQGEPSPAQKTPLKTTKIRKDLDAQKGSEHLMIYTSQRAEITVSEADEDVHTRSDLARPLSGQTPPKMARSATSESSQLIVVHVDEVASTVGPAREILLKIPTSRLARSKRGANQKAGTNAQEAGAPHSFRKDLILSVDTADYDRLFSSMTLRSGTTFLAIFLLGTALSAGLATRFTRPVRRLDAAIRSLSAGHLDTQVELKGKDEIARLGAAFNDMARSLRAHDQRARELTRKEKLSALGQLAAGVAHDVRNPLHSIGLTIEHMQQAARPRDEPSAREFDESVSLIRDEIARLDALVANFLRFTRAETPRGAPLDIHALLEDTTRLVAKEAEHRGIALEWSARDDLAQVIADGEALRSSILNLVLNSFEAMPEGGTLRLTAHGEENGIVLEVQDDGHGIPEEDLRRAFDFAYTTKESGHGLGLAMVHQVIVEEHGGQVELLSTPGKGTLVRLYLPLEREASS